MTAAVGIRFTDKHVHSKFECSPNINYLVNQKCLLFHLSVHLENRFIISFRMFIRVTLFYFGQQLLFLFLMMSDDENSNLRMICVWIVIFRPTLCR